MHTDYCPYQVVSRTSIIVFVYRIIPVHSQAFTDTVCADTANTRTGIDNVLAQTFGPNSRCVEHGELPWTAEQDGVTQERSFWKAGCYNVKYTVLSLFL